MGYYYLVALCVVMIITAILLAIHVFSDDEAEDNDDEPYNYL